MKFPSLRAFFVSFHDALAVCAAWLAAYWLRFNLELPEPYLSAALQTLLWVVPLHLLVFWRSGLYRGIWRFASLRDAQRIVLAVAVAALAVPAVIVFFRIEDVPRSVLVMSPLLLVLMMGASRLAYRIWREHRLSGMWEVAREPVLVLGAGSAADYLLRELGRTPAGIGVVGLLDDDPAKQGLEIRGVPVLGRLDSVLEHARARAVNTVVLALPSAPHETRKRLTERCQEAGLKVLTLPALDDLVSGKVSVATLREVELDDLLGRDPVELDGSGLTALIGGRVVLVTGAGGSIGAELCRQIARFRPARLVLFELSEFALYRMEQELSQSFPELACRYLVGDVKDAARVRAVLQAERPLLVFHAAAYKHVPLMEADNAWEAVRNNVQGTAVVALAAREAGVEKFVLVSTDKAVNPANVMGATKRLAERVCQALQVGASTRFIAVRFGNVLGSSGSVIPKFRAQIAAGGPVTVTHPDITRYFMSIPEAAQLVLQAALMGRGGEIFVLDMGEPVRIADLARLMIRLSGADPAKIGIVYTGLRPGEKLYEELLADGETTLPTPHPKLRIARAREDDPHWLDALWRELQTPPADVGSIQAWLKSYVPEYRPDSLDGGATGVMPNVEPAGASRDGSCSFAAAR